MIREKIKDMLIEQKVIDQEATIEQAMTAFTRVLKLLLLLKPTSYQADMSALLGRAEKLEKLRYSEEIVKEACTRNGLNCIKGAAGEGGCGFSEFENISRCGPLLQRN